MSTTVNNSSRSRTAEEQLHWNSIMDVLTGNARTLTEAKASRMVNHAATLRFEANLKRAHALGLVGELAKSFAHDPAILTMMEQMNQGMLWGDILLAEETETQRLNEQLAALRASKTPGRWRLAASLYA